MDTTIIIRSISPSSWTELSLSRCDMDSKVPTHNTPLTAKEKEVFVNYFDGVLRGRFMEGAARVRGGMDHTRPRALI